MEWEGAEITMLDEMERGENRQHGWRERRKIGMVDGLEKRENNHDWWYGNAGK